MVIDSLKSNFGNNFVTSEHLCIDESLLLFKGRLGFRQYIPLKRSQFGIKLIIICDSATGYVLDFIIYTGASTEITNRNAPDIGKSGQIVLTLMEKYLDKSHTLYMAN
ncbi:hypothetical protein NQ314_016530 [Rhamnusium bicolor]|uniref:PiggyBac transposable element-derived protein domain-containing protein n=1 Tax=Rhamnusium bicolor TaxID=1586634 RepID=A0AAV8WVM6_9CUCU|nr:hypothetical protein NQ314_016530 [Rhamnusium bicolor]